MAYESIVKQSSGKRLATELLVLLLCLVVFVLATSSFSPANKPDSVKSRPPANVSRQV